MSDKVLTSFRIEKKLHQKLKKVADNEGMTMQGFIIKAVVGLMKLIQSEKNF